MQYISALCGTTNVTESGEPEPLVRMGMLKHLKKTHEYKEVLFIRDDIVYRGKLPDCDTYPCIQKYKSGKPCDIPAYSANEVQVVTPDLLWNALRNNWLRKPFCRRESKKGKSPKAPCLSPSRENDKSLTDLRKELDELQNELTGLYDILDDGTEE